MPQQFAALTQHTPARTIHFSRTGEYHVVCGNGSCWLYSLMCALGALQHDAEAQRHFYAERHPPTTKPTEVDIRVSALWLQDVQRRSATDLDVETKQKFAADIAALSGLQAFLPDEGECNSVCLPPRTLNRCNP